MIKDLTKTVPLLCAICFFNVAAAATAPSKLEKTGGLAGYVRDKSDNTDLRYVNVYLHGTVLGSTTDGAGYFQIDRIPLGTYTLIVRMMGYRTLVVKNVVIYPGKLRVLSLRLRKMVLELGGVKITADKATQLVDHERSLAGHEIIQPRAVTMQAGALEDAYRAMASLPSVTSRNDLNTQLYIRGGSPDQNLVLFDGIEILNPSRLFVLMGGGVSVVNPDIVQSLDLAPGGFEANYGNKMSALLRITTREGRRDRVSVSSSASLTNARAVAEGPLADGNGSWLIAGRRSFYDVVANTVYSRNYLFPYFYDMHAKLAYNFSHNSKLWLFYSHLGEGAQLYDFENESLDLLNKGKGNIAGIRYNSILSPKLAVNFLTGYYTDNNDVNVYDTENYAYHAKLNYDVRRFSLQGDIHYYPYSWLLFRTGSQVLFSRTHLLWDMDWRNYLALPDGIHFNSQYNLNSAYWQTRFRIDKWCELTTGMRYDYSTLYNEARLSPRLKIIFVPSPESTVWYSTGRYSQYPDLLTIISRGEPLDITQNTENLCAETAVHHIWGFKWEPARNQQFKVELYKKSFDRLLVADVNSSYVARNSGIGFARGLEVSYQFNRAQIDRYAFWVNYALAEAKYRSDNGIGWINFDYDRLHQMAAGLDVKIYRNWSIGAIWHYGSGFPYTPILALRRNPNSTTGPIDGWELIKEAKNSARYPDYSRFDLRFMYQHPGKTRTIAAYIDFMNLFNHRNIYSYEWDFYDLGANGAVAKRSVMYMVPFLPSFGISFSL